MIEVCPLGLSIFEEELWEEFSRYGIGHVGKPKGDGLVVTPVDVIDSYKWFLSSGASASSPHCLNDEEALIEVLLIKRVPLDKVLEIQQLWRICYSGNH